MKINKKKRIPPEAKRQGMWRTQRALLLALALGTSTLALVHSSDAVAVASGSGSGVGQRGGRGRGRAEGRPLQALDDGEGGEDGSEEGAGEEAPGGEGQEFTVRHAVGAVASYQKAHPDFAASLGVWIVVGNLFFLIGLVLMLFSEVKAVLICRDQDFRKSLYDRGYMKPASAGIAELEARESIQMRPRAYLTVGGMMLMYTGLSCIIYPLCDILDIVGLPAWPCALLVIFGAFFAAFVVACLWLAVVWSCTRSYAAAAFFVIGFSGLIMLPTGNLILTLLWCLVAFGGGWWYFSYLPESYEAASEEPPFWVQDVGEMTVTCDPGDWGDATTTTWSNVRDETAEAIGMKRE